MVPVHTYSRGENRSDSYYRREFYVFNHIFVFSLRLDSIGEFIKRKCGVPLSISLEALVKPEV